MLCVETGSVFFGDMQYVPDEESCSRVTYQKGAGDPYQHRIGGHGHAQTLANEVEYHCERTKKHPTEHGQGEGFKLKPSWPHRWEKLFGLG